MIEKSIRESVRRRRKRHQRQAAGFIVSIMFLIMVVFAVRYIGKEYKLFGIPHQEQAVKGLVINLKQIHSKDLVLLDRLSGQTIVSRNGESKIYPASLTKIMTALVVIENCSNLNQTITMPSDFYQELYNQNASMAGFLPGEQVNLKDLLYGIILPSGAECCQAFAEKIAGSEQAFVKIMNKKAKEIGMKNTNFMNCTGLHDKKHYSTVDDISVLLEYALKNETFREVFTTSCYTTKASKQHTDGITFHSTMFKALEDAKVSNGTILGGKTGFTDEAGLCLASLASINGKEYILVTAKAEGTHDTDQYHVKDAINIYNQIGQ